MAPRNGDSGMKLAVSNIAWPREQDAAVADLLAGLGVTGIEVAPTKISPVRGNLRVLKCLFAACLGAYDPPRGK